MAYNIGDSVIFDVSWDYQGPLYYGARLKCAVGIKNLLFNEVDKQIVNLILPETLAWEKFTQRVIVILNNAKLGMVYDTHVKLDPNIWGEDDIHWYGIQNVQMGALAPDSEFRNLTVLVG